MVRPILLALDIQIHVFGDELNMGNQKLDVWLLLPVNCSCTLRVWMTHLERIAS